MSVVRACPASTAEDPHELVSNMRRHCPPDSPTCGWVRCLHSGCGATVDLKSMRYFMGGTS